jgi:hypothetical protein
MASICDLLYRTTLTNSDGSISAGPGGEHRWSPATDGGDRRSYTIAATTFQALTVPTGADAVVILPGTATSLTLKGVTGDTGVALTPSSGPIGLPILLPLGASPSIGIYNGASSSQTITVIFL